MSEPTFQQMEPGGTEIGSVAIAGDQGDYGVYFYATLYDASQDTSAVGEQLFPQMFFMGQPGVSELFLVTPDPDDLEVSPDADQLLVSPGRAN
jgi:hypothetical protein